MDIFCSALDDKSALGFLETDKPENVGFYKRFGFEVVKKVQVIGTTTFFMARAARMAKRSNTRMHLRNLRRVSVSRMAD